MNEEVLFLDVETVITIHDREIEAHGGSHGLRDAGLLDAAVAAPAAGFAGQWAHASIFEMAAAYAFHIAKNHPFIDGNKRAGLASALAFLDVNGIEVSDTAETSDLLVSAMEAIAKGEMDKPTMAKLLLEHSVQS